MTSMAMTSTAIGQAGTRNDGRHLGVALLVIATAQLMVVLDATIVNVALRHIQTAFGFSGSGLEWVVNAYALVLGGLGYAYAISSDKNQARAVLRSLENQASTQYVDPYAFAVVYAGLGDKDKGFMWLERANEDRDCWIAFLNAEPMLDSLRSDPRFSSLSRRLGLPVSTVAGQVSH